MGGAGIGAERPGGARRDGSGMACPGRVRQGRFGAWWRFRESSRIGTARPGAAWQVRAGQCKAWLGLVRQGFFFNSL